MSKENEITGREEEKKELKTAETGEYVVALTKPFEFEGKKYEKLDFTPFLDLKYDALIDARQMTITQGYGNDIFMERSWVFVANLISIALDLPLEAMLNVSISDARELRNMVSNFL